MDYLINEFISYLKDVRRASQNTVSAYRNDLDKLKDYYEKQGINDVSRISGTNLNSYILSLEKDGMKPASVSRNIASIRAFLLFLLKKGVIRDDPAEFIKPPKVIKKHPLLIDTDKINLLLGMPDITTNKGKRDKAMLELLYATGMKVTELITLKTEDISLSGRYLALREKRERIIPFGNAARAALEEYLKIRDKAFNKTGSDILFLNAKGGSFSRQGLWKLLKEYALAAGIQSINPNMIRNSFAAHMLDNGADLASVQEFLGYSDMGSYAYLSRSGKSSREVYMNTHPRA